MKKKQTIFTPQFIVLLLALFAANYGLYCLNATVPVFVSDIGGAATASGVLNTCFALSACAARLAGGFCADRFGRKRIIVTGGLLLAVGTAGYGSISAFPLLMLFRAVQGVGYAVMSVGASTALIDILPKERLGEGIGISALAGTLSASIAPTICLAIIGSAGFSTVFVTTAAVAACGMAAVLLFCNYEKKRPAAAAPARETEPQQDRPVGLIWRVLEKNALLPAAIYTLFTLGFSITYVFMTLYAVSSGIANPGSYFIASSLCQIFARIVSGKFADRGNVTPMILLGGTLGILSYLGLFLSSSGVVYLLCGALFGICNGLTAPVMNRLAVMDAAPHRRGAASATYFISADIGNMLGGMIWGALIDVLPYSACFGIVTVWMAAALGAALLFLAFRGRNRRKRAK